MFCFSPLLVSSLLSLWLEQEPFLSCIAGQLWGLGLAHVFEGSIDGKSEGAICREGKKEDSGVEEGGEYTSVVL